MSVAPIAVLIVEDDSRTRERLARVVAGEPRFEVCDCVGNLEQAKLAIARRLPAVVLLDLGLPDGNGVSLIHLLQMVSSAIEVLVISVMGDERSVLGAIEAGAGGYLLKDSADTDVIAAIDQLLEGGAPLSPSIAVHLMRRLQSPPAQPAREEGPRLTERELELLRLIAKGLSYDEVGRLMGLRYNTVASYAKELYRKLQVHSRSEAIFEATQLGLVASARP
jgi:DNA-binding NarL/FixJ family response regulator